MTFQNLKLTLADPSVFDPLGEQLIEAGALSVTLEDAEDKPVLEPLPNEIILWEKAILLALFPREISLDPLIAILKKQYPSMHCEVVKVPEKKWETVWAENAKPLCFQNYLWVCSSAHAPLQTDQPVVHLDPGLAFGTGTHPTTALCLEWLVDHRDCLKGKAIIDYGCGSGILAIAALKLGAEKVYAIDHDLQALQATEENAKINAISSECLVTSLPAIMLPQVDILLANILANPLIELAADFSKKIKPQGCFVLSGILTTQYDEVRKAYAPYFSEIIFQEREGWLVVSGIMRF